MFFKNIKDWGSKKLFWVWMIFEAVYFALMCVAPITTILIKYDLFFKKENSSTISGIALVFLIIGGVIGLHNFKKIINKFEETTIAQQRIKYTLNCVYGLAFPIALLFLSNAFVDNVQLAHSTLSICCAFFIGGIVTEHMFISFLDRERFIRANARLRKEEEDRITRGVV